jgi:hypothetical protein
MARRRTGCADQDSLCLCSVCWLEMGGGRKSNNNSNSNRTAVGIEARAELPTLLQHRMNMKLPYVANQQRAGLLQMLPMIPTNLLWWYPYGSPIYEASSLSSRGFHFAGRRSAGNGNTKWTRRRLNRVALALAYYTDVDNAAPQLHHPKTRRTQTQTPTDIGT